MWLAGLDSLSSRSKQLSKRVRRHHPKPFTRSRTSSSLQARPPPVEAVFRFLEMPYSCLSMASDVGMYTAGGALICVVGDILRMFFFREGISFLFWLCPRMRNNVMVQSG